MQAPKIPPIDVYQCPGFEACFDTKGANLLAYYIVAIQKWADKAWLNCGVADVPKGGN